MNIGTYLYFNGQCEAAFKFYEKCFGGEVAFMGTYGGSPMQDQVPPEMHSKVMHATLKVGDESLMGADVMPGQYHPPKGFSMSIALADPVEAERIFTALAQNGKIELPFEKTFWAKGFGMVTDQFGVPWMVNCE